MAGDSVRVDLDQNCIHCGEPGTVMVGTDRPGLCLKCIGDLMEMEDCDLEAVEEKKEFTHESVKHVFTEEEKREIASEMARQVSIRENFEDEKKALTSEFNSKIDGAKAQINSAAQKINNGYEYQTVKCQVIRDFESRMVQFFRVDTGELAKERPMTGDELQMKLV